MRIDADQLDLVAREWDAAVDRTPDADEFCASSIWSFAAAASFPEHDPPVVVTDGGSFAGMRRATGEEGTRLLLGLDPSITLILIEHDMDIALRVAHSVTMMHDGRVIVEGTPDEIRANERVHALYLGSRT